MGELHVSPERAQSIGQSQGAQVITRTLSISRSSSFVLYESHGQYFPDKTQQLKLVAYIHYKHSLL